MFTAGRGRRAVLGAVVVGAALALAGCASSNPLSTGGSDSGASKGTLVVGSQAYYSNEIIAQLYTLALEDGGYKVTKDYQIGQREVYLPQLEAGKIDVFPEYVGDLTQQGFDKTVTSGTKEEIYADLKKALPSNLKALDLADAADANSWTVTDAFAQKWKLTDLASLKNVKDPIVVGGNAELETRPYGPTALKEKYGVTTAGFKAVQDSGGPLTVKALVDGDIQLANIYTADPNIKSNHLKALADPDGLFLPDNVVPIVSKKVDSGAQKIIDSIQAKLSQADLVDLNSQSVNDKKSTESIAKAWLTKNGLLKK